MFRLSSKHKKSCLSSVFISNRKNNFVNIKLNCMSLSILSFKILTSTRQLEKLNIHFIKSYSWTVAVQFPPLDLTNFSKFLTYTLKILRSGIEGWNLKQVAKNYLKFIKTRQSSDLTKYFFHMIEHFLSQFVMRDLLMLYSNISE